MIFFVSMKALNMFRRFHAASPVVLAAVFLMIQSGCREEASKWEATQKASEGKTAAESSRDRLENAPGKLESQDSPVALDENLGEMPQFNPGADPATDSAAIVWTPKELKLDTPVETKVDLASLVAGEPLPGSEFNKFFPVQSATFDTVAKQEKSGFSQYSLQREGDEIGQLSITDLRSNPEAAKKFETPDMRIANYPAKRDGSKGTTLLVAGRFQVKIRSPEGQLNEQDRVSWLQKFDLKGVGSLAN